MEYNITAAAYAQLKRLGYAIDVRGTFPMLVHPRGWMQPFESWADALEAGMQLVEQRG